MTQEELDYLIEKNKLTLKEVPMSSKKQTAVEWLFEQMYKEPRSELSFAITGCKVDKMFNQAIALEKEQIIEAWIDGEGYNDIAATPMAEKYYKETYNK